VTSNGPVAVRNAFVKSKLGAEYKTAELTLSADLRNQTDKDVKGTWWRSGRADVETGC